MEGSWRPPPDITCPSSIIKRVLIDNNGVGSYPKMVGMNKGGWQINNNGVGSSPKMVGMNKGGWQINNNGSRFLRGLAY